MIVACIEKKSLLLNNWICLFIIAIVATFFATFFIVNNTYSAFFNGFFPHLLLLWVCSLLILYFLTVYLLKTGRTQNLTSFLFLILLSLVSLEVIAINMAGINNWPFSLSWSETSHLYYSSTIFAREIYGFSVPMSPYHETRYLMQSLPFLFSGIPIWVHRFWQFLLTIGFPIIFMFSLLKRVRIEPGLKSALFIVWGFLWLLQIYIFYNLILCALLIVCFYSNDHWKRNILVICVASAWAGFSRPNWIPVPGLMAALFYLLETRYKTTSGLIEYVKKPLLYFISGVAVGLLAQFIYILISGYQNSAPQTTVFRSPMLWYRLLPNATFILGILPGILLISLFLIIYVISKFFINQDINIFRRIGVVLIVVAFFLGGLVVSVKIGGGNNLHNMDAYAMFVLIIASYIFSGKISLDKKSTITSHDNKQWLLIGILIVPIVWALFFPAQVNTSSQVDSDSVLKTVNEIIDTYAKNRKVLFISQRQLLFLGYVKNVPLIPDFEQESLIDMTMAGPRGRLEDFYQKLRDHAFEIIVVNPINTNIVGLDSSFAEENNLWVQGVSRLILNQYQPLVSFPEYGLEMLIPKTANQSVN